MSGIRLSQYHAVMPSGLRTPLWWRLVAPLARRSRVLRAAVFGLPRSRIRTALLALYYRDIVRDMQAGDIERHFPAIDPSAIVHVFGMESFRGHQGAKEALGTWLEIFSGMQFEMTEFLNPNDTEMLCIGSGTGVGAASGATVTGNEFVFCVKVIDGMAVELSISESKSKALEAAGLSE